MHQPFISAFERGTSTPRPETLARLLEATKTRPSIVLELRREEVLPVAARHRASNVRVFGSAVHGTDVPGSDIDLLVSFDAESTLLDLVGFANAVEDILGYHVDVITDDAPVRPIGELIAREAVPL